MFFIKSLKFILWLESVFSLDYENNFCLSVFKVSLKSFIVIKELEEDTIFWLSFYFLIFKTFLHHNCMIFTLLMMYLASSIYFLVIYPRKTFWILVAALCNFGSSDLILWCDLLSIWHPSVLTDFKSGYGKKYLSLLIKAD